MFSATKTGLKSALAVCVLAYSALASADVRYEINGWFLTPNGGSGKSTLVYVAPNYITESTLLSALEFAIAPQSNADYFEFLTPNASNPVRFDSVRISYPGGHSMYEHFPLGSLSSVGNYTGLFLSTLSVSAVPEPSSGILVALGAFAVVLLRRSSKTC